ncbi:MAG: hypothetical protein M1825_001336 [Sarcosagium campestre]|nr:MAG: hypothetical protein M1825_001336 [Sarcosagium campestre]
MVNDMISLFGLALIALSIVYISLNQKQQETLLQYLHFNRRRSSASKIPTRSPSPEKKDGKGSTLITDYRDVFPPSRRSSLANVPAFSTEQAKKLKITTPAPEQTKTAIAPLDTPLEDLNSPAFTPTEFSHEDIKALGDFPDYAQLSGVPLPQPWPEFDINKAIARPYPLAKLQPDWWLELESSYKERIVQRQELVRRHGKAVLDYLPGSELACKELMEMALQFLCARYPHYFSLSEDKTVFRNGILKTETRLRQVRHPLYILLDNVPEDFAVMLRDPTNGFYYFRAGVICSALGWNVGSKIGMQLHEIHGPIPDYKEKMQFSMDRYFSKLPTDKPIQRGSWGLEVDRPLYMPPGDPHEAHRLRQAPELSLDRVHLRVDWQTLRRLPLSGAIVFNFKALFTPLTAFRDEAHVPALCLKSLRDGKPALMQYKNTWHVEHIAIPALATWVEEQERNGLVPPNWQEHTLHESPWFPRWEEKWRREQGF